MGFTAAVVFGLCIGVLAGWLVGMLRAEEQHGEEQEKRFKQLQQQVDDLSALLKDQANDPVGQRLAQAQVDLMAARRERDAAQKALMRQQAAEAEEQNSVPPTRPNPTLADLIAKAAEGRQVDATQQSFTPSPAAERVPQPTDTDYSRSE